MRRIGFIVDDFERAFDEFFDEMLISRWRVQRGGADWERSRIVETADTYEVMVAAPGVSPEDIEVDVAGNRITVRAPSGVNASFERSYEFSLPIDRDSVEARWSDGTLRIIVPKQKPKRIKVG